MDSIALLLGRAVHDIAHEGSFPGHRRGHGVFSEVCANDHAILQAMSILLSIIQSFQPIHENAESVPAEIDANRTTLVEKFYFFLRFRWKPPGTDSIISSVCLPVGGRPLKTR
ncbi:MAG: hypothetical protein WC674_07215 [Candidatus Krumholzibacteriia bacterium]